jgi:hypothetical protein
MKTKTKKAKKKVAKKKITVVRISSNKEKEDKWEKAWKKEKAEKEAVEAKIMKEAEKLFPTAFAEMEELGKKIINAKTFDRKLELDKKLDKMEKDFLLKIASKFTDKEVLGRELTREERRNYDFKPPLIELYRLKEMIFDFGKIEGKSGQINDLNQSVNSHLCERKQKAGKEKNKELSGKMAMLKKDLSFGAKSDTNSYGITFPKGAVGTVMSVRDASGGYYNRNNYIPRYQAKVLIRINGNYGHHFWVDLKDISFKK